MKRRIRIAFFIGSLGRGGAENQLLHLLGRLDTSVFDTRLILLHGEGRERADGLVPQITVLDHTNESFRYHGGRIARASRTLWKLQKCFRNTRPDILHCILPTACVLGVAAGRLSGVPQIICSRRALVESYRSAGVLTWSDQQAMRRADIALANSAAVSHELSSRDGVRPERVRLIYNGVDVHAFQSASPNGLRSSVSASPESVLIGTIANFFSYKRHVDLVEAARMLAPKYPFVRFVLSGREEGTQCMIRGEIERLGLQDHFSVLNETPNVVPLFKSLDIYACSSETEGFSNVLLEAMAAGKPVVATSVGGNPDAVSDGQTGILVPPRDPAALASALEKLINNGDLRRRMGDAGLQRVSKEFSLDAMVRRHHDLYSSLSGG
ncbi:MAG: glycosyltransferase [Candidatus Acidiferrales bacterium]